MNVRVLRPDEYGLLKGIADGYSADPANSAAVVAFDDERHPVGRMLLVALAHIEGTWIAESHRGGSVGFRMERLVADEARKASLDRLLAYTTEPQHGDYMRRLGYRKLNWEVWEKEL